MSFLYAGWDKHFGFQLYHSDPSGNYAGWGAHCIGSNSSNAQSILKSDFKEEMTLEEAKKLAVKILLKTMDATSLSSEKCKFLSLVILISVEFGTLTLKNGKPSFHFFTTNEIDLLLKTEGVLTTKDDTRDA